MDDKKTGRSLPLGVGTLGRKRRLGSRGPCCPVWSGKGVPKEEQRGQPLWSGRAGGRAGVRVRERREERKSEREGRIEGNATLRFVSGLEVSGLGEEKRHAQEGASDRRARDKSNCPGGKGEKNEKKRADEARVVGIMVAKGGCTRKMRGKRRRESVASEPLRLGWGGGWAEGRGVGEFVGWTL